MPIHDETRLRALRFTGRANHLSISQRTADSFRSITCGRRTILMTMTSSVESHSLWKVGRMRFHLPFHFTEKGRHMPIRPGGTWPNMRMTMSSNVKYEFQHGDRCESLSYIHRMQGDSRSLGSTTRLYCHIGTFYDVIVSTRARVVAEED